MQNIIKFVKDKSYYFLGGTVLILVIMIAISACSSNFSSSYTSIENKMVSSAKKYYNSNPNLLPKEVGGKVRVSIATLVDEELIKEVYDVKDKNNKCSGYVEVTKVEDDYSYIPFLTCKGNYEPRYLSDKVKDSKPDEYGNGSYEVEGEYIYRGDDVNNYVKFNNRLWRIVKVDKDGDIKIVLSEELKELRMSYDDSYNSDANHNYGIVTNYGKTYIRKNLKTYYEKEFDKDSKAKIVAKNLCIGSYAEEDEYSKEKDCSVVAENEVIGLLTAYDYKMASLSDKCIKLSDNACSNYNYLSDVYTWLSNTKTNSSYEAFFLNGNIRSSYAKTRIIVQPVLYLSKDVLIQKGVGTLEKPYIIK